jgi:uncharacterized membrane protein
LESLIALALLAALLLPIISIIGLILGMSASSRLEVIERRLAVLETAGNGRAAPPRSAAPSAPDAEPPPAAAAAQADGIATPAAEPLPAPPPPVSAAPPTGAEPRPAEGAQAAPPAPPSPPPAPPAPIPPPPAAGPDFEERFGTRWVVWAGGLALALGGVFMVRYAIEQGYIGPAVRIALGALLAAVLVAAGEWLRRHPPQTGAGRQGAGPPSADIPSILTAAGTTVAYATVYAAYSLYDFIGPAAAFVLLSIVALATLGAALLHGPALAALGLVGAELSPLLAPSPTPNFWALYVYLAVATAAAFALARLRLWRWLAITALAFGALWAWPGFDNALAGDAGPVGLHAIAGFGLAALLIVAGLFWGPATEPDRADALSSAAVSVYLVIAALTVLFSSHATGALATFALLTAATVAVAWRSSAAAAALPVAAVAAALVIVTWSVKPELEHLIAPGPGPDPSASDLALHYVTGAFFAALFGISGYLAQGRDIHARYGKAAIPLIWAAVAVLTPVAILITLYYQIHGLERSLLFAAVAVGLSAWFAVASERLTQGGPRPGAPAAAALNAAGSVAALALALTFALDKGWLTVSLALMAPGIAFVADKRPLPLLRWIAAVMAGLVVMRLAYEPRVVGDDLGATPFFNWLLWGYGAPALAFWSAGILLRRRADDAPSRILDAAAILFSVLFVVLEIRHYMTGGDIYAEHGGLGELALQLCALLAVAIGLEWLRRRTGNVVHNAGALVVAAAALLLVAAVLGHDNPRMTGLPVGGPFLNLVLLGYGLPAVLATTLAVIARRTRPMPYRMVAAGASVVLALAYATLETMRLFHGPELTGMIDDAESYTFSAVWLFLGVALLFIALPLDSKPTRLASAAVVTITTAKVFLLDLANLAGFWRALSFIGLGLVLVGIGYLYQRVLFPAQPSAASQGS